MTWFQFCRTQRAYKGIFYINVDRPGLDNFKAVVKLSKTDFKRIVIALTTEQNISQTEQGPVCSS